MENFKNLTLKDLREKAKNLGVTGYSKMKKEDLINTIEAMNAKIAHDAAGVSDYDITEPVVETDLPDASELFRMFLSFNPAKSWWEDKEGVTHYNRVFFYSEHYKEWLTVDAEFDRWATKFGRSLGVTLEDLKKDLIGENSLMYVCVKTHSGKIMLSYNREKLGDYRKKAEELTGPGTFKEVLEGFKKVLEQYCAEHKAEIDIFKAAHPEEKKKGGVAHAPAQKTESVSTKENVDEDCPV